ncbi:MAG: hypothetical protein HKN92_01695 [Chitinophagales bacterium]|nr:hypothetical protein [Chitinophagales bacterium]
MLKITCVGCLSLMLILTSILPVSSQTTVAQRVPASEKVIPPIVLHAFNKQYPNSLLKGWFVTHISYWQGDYSSGWYTDWYGPRSITIYRFEKPTYFEVEFINAANPGEISRAIYNVYGYWYETRSMIKGLPMKVIESLKNSDYGGWKISEFKERIESPGWPVDVYRFKVSKGLKSKIIRIDEQGNLVQARDIGD